ncbi:MAG TPA: hypothetical protein VMU83_16165 [Hanamia sp.]|nr:hypothetical protein [Hanamia sp.]
MEALTVRTFYQCPQSKLVLGHLRLSLFDLSDCGRQPMMFQDRYVISFNGEIYNFHELKNELTQSGVCFHAQTDTEVILAAFAKWNTQSFNKLSGMFAFALYDILEKNLFLVKDASGIKPLYYSSSSGSVVFASEMRAFSIIENK